MSVPLMSCNSNVGSTSAFAAPAELTFDGVRIIFSLKFRPVRASSLCQVNTLAVAKTDKIKNSSALAICRTREKSQAKHFAIFHDSIANFNSRRTFGANRSRPGVRLPILAIGKDERGEDGDIHHAHIAKLRDDIAAAIDHDRQVRLRFFQKIPKHSVEHRDVFNG